MYRAFIADYAAGRPVCTYLTEDARASDLGGVVDSALELFEASAPPVLASPRTRLRKHPRPASAKASSVSGFFERPRSPNGASARRCRF